LIALASVCGACLPARAAAPPEAGISALDIIELEIGYTTILARFYKAIAPRTLVDGARTGIASELELQHIDARLPLTPAHVDLYGGGDLIDTLVLRTLATYGRRVDGHRLVQAALAGELGALNDPYSVLFFPQQFKKFNAFLGNGKIGGIGAILSYDEKAGLSTIERVVAGGPAEAAGLRAGDTIVSIDGRSMLGVGGSDLRDALRGKIGSTVRVAIRRGETVTTYAIVRAEIHDLEVTQRQFGSVGYLGLSRFGDRAGEEIASDLHDLEAHGATSFVLDLRGNGGGYGDEATTVASSFIASGPIFTTRERNGATTVARASGVSTFHARLAVLVDGDTASAAEIVAGAIQDDRAGTIVGVRTFGKGVVQSVYPLPDGSAFKLTTARYTTPNGRDIDRVGIVPDLMFAEPSGAELGDPATDPQLAQAIATVSSDPTLAPPPAAPVPVASAIVSPSPSPR
jgi:carboxyl-terminal processing protease